MEWMTLFYWTLDMAMSCVTGVVKAATRVPLSVVVSHAVLCSSQDGATCMDFSTILKTYLKSWFPLDVLVVGPDWIFTIIGLANGSSEGALLTAMSQRTDFHTSVLSPMSLGSDTADSGRLLRVIRTARVARLLRLVTLCSKCDVWHAAALPLLR
eukprot:4319432-Amphidinium_carterae.1